MNARRVTIYRDRAGGWRYKVQAGNWKIVAASEESFTRKRHVMDRVKQSWPGVEIVEV